MFHVANFGVCTLATALELSVGTMYNWSMDVNNNATPVSVYSHISQYCRQRLVLKVTFYGLKMKGKDFPEEGGIIVTPPYKAR
jgi:hypothetical protein